MKARDNIDEQLLHELRLDGRIPLSTLSARVHLSRNAVRERISRLERDGIIVGYTIKEQRYDQVAVVGAYVFVQRVDRLRGNEVINLLTQIPEVVHCDVVSGEFDLIVRIESSSTERVQTIWQEIAQHPGVADTTTAFTLSNLVNR